MSDIKSNVTVRNNGKSEKKEVTIQSELHPEIHNKLLEKWQGLIDITAKIINVPSSLIMKLDETGLEVFVSSETEGNPYNSGDKPDNQFGVYCETVIGTQEKLLVPNPANSEDWKNNTPDKELGIKAYLGYPINWPNGDVFGTVCMLDVKENNYSENYIELLSKIKQHIENDLNLLISNSKLDNANIAKDRIFSIISHDLRGPVGSIRSMLEFLSSGAFDFSNTSDLLEFIEQAKKSASLTFTLLENLLAWSKSQRNEMVYTPEPISLNKIVEDNFGLFAKEIDEKDLFAINDIDSDIIVNADKNMLTTVFRNLIVNAIKFSDKETSFTVSCEKENDEYLIKVEDEGIGIKPEHIPMMFDINSYKMNVGTNQEKGTGFGLLLCKEFVEKHRGKIWVESTVGEGSTFSFTIPVK